MKKCGNQARMAGNGQGGSSHSDVLGSEMPARPPSLPMLPRLPGRWTARIQTTLGSVGAAPAGSPRLSPVLIYVFHISSLPSALREEVKGGNGVHNSDLYNLLAALVKGFGPRGGN